MSTNESDKKASGPDMPPTPRDFNDARFSELVPLKSKSINVAKSPLFYLVVLTGILVVALFQYLNDILSSGSTESFSYIVWGTILYLLGVVLLMVFLYSKTDKPFWYFCIGTAFVALLLLTPLSLPYFYVFRQILPGGETMTGSREFSDAFVGMFFGAGMMEELMKVTLVIAGAYLAVKGASWKEKLPSWLYDAVKIRGPLDGLLMGLFGGAGFILIETGAQYVPNIVQGVAGETGNLGTGLAAGLMLLLPRVIGGMVGHMAWAGITGYFVGLAVIRPAQALKFVPAAWVGTSALHAMWNTQEHIAAFGYISVLISGVFLVSCLLKARQLEMAMGRSVDTYGSVVVEPASRAQPPSTAGTADAAPPQAPVARPAPARSAASLGIAIGGTVIPIVTGSRISFDGISGLNESAGEIQAEVTKHPTREDVLGLKNLGASEWVAHLRDGTEQRIPNGRNVRLAPGVSIEFGVGDLARVVET